jgi:hypothetical protein
MEALTDRLLIISINNVIHSIPAHAVGEGENIHARPCGCGNVQLSFGAFTAHFTEPGLRELADRIDEALRELRYRALSNPVDMGVAGGAR